ncbi:hypothetical protein CR513_39348, partial [Mucuna pruriens]
MKLNPIVHHSTPPPPRSRMVDPNPNPNPNDWSIHHNKDDLIFPPIEHENLKISSSDSDSDSDSDEHIPQSPPPPFHSQLRGWTAFALQMLRSKLSSFRNTGPFWSFGLPAAALLISFWIIISTIRKKKTLTSNELRLINIIKDKDWKIAQLLHQIAQMNEILIDRHKALAAKVE